ncbi:MAG: hypothetical protein ACI3Z5_06985 [Paludibacteraceae bacterium]
MKHIHFFCIALLMFVTTGAATAQVSQIVYASDSLSGELQIREADCASGRELYWTIQLPQNKNVQITRINNTYFLNPSGISILENEVNPILDYANMGTYKDTLINKNTVTVVINNPGYQVAKDPMFTIRFAVIGTDAVSASTGFGGNVEIFNGMLNVAGSQAYMGSNVSAILGSDYSDYTCFGSPQGGRIRGSNSGYLILEGNPNGYGNKNVYINRYVAGGDILMTSSTGKVGIGIDDPQEKLHIAGYIRGNGSHGELQIRTTKGTTAIGATNETYSHFNTDRPMFYFNHGLMVEDGKIGSYIGKNLKFFTFDQERMTILCNGNVGIGKTIPEYKLDIDGTLRAKKILVNTSEGADFVFDDDYQLRPLQEVSNFIHENGHLPEIQSAADMQENGVSITDLQIQLLQKIEELTLYLIQQEQTIQQLQDEVKELRK